jgi:hypothetical protein
MVAQLAEAGKLTRDDIRDIERLIDERERAQKSGRKGGPR